ncbi:MAG: 6-hydroxymethylpterin diphosphokinase MptE-like protein [Phycisphaeraceae bacterium]
MSILEANLQALRRSVPALAQRIADAAPAPLQWQTARSGVWTASLSRDGRDVPLGSRFDPEKEATKLLSGLDYQRDACVVLLGVGLGYHVARAVRDMGDRGVIVAYEPDRAVLRAVLEQVDHTAWLGRRNVLLADDEMDRAALTQRLDRFASTLTQGTRLVTHPAARQRAAEALQQFGQAVTDTVAYFRTTVATALVNSARTCRNLACNLDQYVAGATADELHNAAQGYPAVCVAAGPSLARNVELLRDPKVREKVVVISVQTTLKPLLDRGIRPDFVTALDYSAICKRFYEGLPELPDVTLVVEPKAHPAILDAFPGPIRVLASEFNDKLLGEMARPRIPLKSGATVAHLSLYLAQHLGCDPIIFIGQDLGFSDGLYYAPGTAVHQVWSSELNPFNTLEMMEWQRVVRNKGHLKRLEDVNGQPIFSDEQMITYLKQFERDFADAPQTIIDATEGGVPKSHTTTMTLREALDQYATRPLPKLPEPPQALDLERLSALDDLLDERRREVRELKATSRKTIPILRQMQQHQRDRQRMEKLHHQLQKHQRRVHTELSSAFTLVNALNTLGAFKRNRADRAISHLAGDAFERQGKQLERDIENLEWLIQACDEAQAIFREAHERVTARQRKRAEMPVHSAA